SAIEQGNAAIYGSAHERRGMENGLAYHFVIGNGIDSGDGEIEIGPRWHKQLRGGHVRSTQVNDVGIGICLVGNFENHPPTPRQHTSLILLVDYLRDNCVARDYTFTVHKWVDGGNHTLCPGKHFPYKEMSGLYRS
ncbi:MAG: peptidoglycan recognition protein family protein, partial [Puniceicoccales bacterium]